MDGYLVGKFPNWDRWGEWNGIYRDTARRFLKGDPGLKSQFASSLCGRCVFVVVIFIRMVGNLNDTDVMCVLFTARICTR